MHFSLSAFFKTPRQSIDTSEQLLQALCLFLQTFHWTKEHFTSLLTWFFSWTFWVPETRHRKLRMPIQCRKPDTEIIRCRKPDTEKLECHFTYKKTPKPTDRFDAVDLAYAPNCATTAFSCAIELHKLSVFRAFEKNKNQEKNTQFRQVSASRRHSAFPTKLRSRWADIAQGAPSGDTKARRLNPDFQGTICLQDTSPTSPKECCVTINNFPTGHTANRCCHRVSSVISVTFPN